jgi:hypothetical protein
MDQVKRNEDMSSEILRLLRIQTALTTSSFGGHSERRLVFLAAR